jgi:hypothetical protein
MRKSRLFFVVFSLAAGSLICYLIMVIVTNTREGSLKGIDFKGRSLFCDGFSFLETSEGIIEIFENSEIIGSIKLDSLSENSDLDLMQDELCLWQFERIWKKDFRDKMLFYEADFSLNRAEVYIEDSVFIRVLIPQNTVLSCETNMLNYSRMIQFVQDVQVK